MQLVVLRFALGQPDASSSTGMRFDYAIKGPMEDLRLVGGRGSGAVERCHGERCQRGVLGEIRRESGQTLPKPCSER